MSFLGEDWVMGEDGLRYRHASRVLVVDPRGRLLLARGHDLDDVHRHWWFTIGGGREPGESARAAAVRELSEETGIAADPGDLIGPVISRSALFDFAAEPVRQHEEYFLLHLAHTPEFDTSGWTEVERRMIEELRWWELTALETTAEQVYPQGLATLLARVLHGWDGCIIRLGEVHDPK